MDDLAKKAQNTFGGLLTLFSARKAAEELSDPSDIRNLLNGSQNLVTSISMGSLLAKENFVGDKALGVALSPEEDKAILLHGKVRALGDVARNVLQSAYAADMAFNPRTLVEWLTIPMYVEFMKSDYNAAMSDLGQLPRIMTQSEGPQGLVSKLRNESALKK